MGRVEEGFAYQGAGSWIQQFFFFFLGGGGGGGAGGGGGGSQTDVSTGPVNSSAVDPQTRLLVILLQVVLRYC